MIKYLPTIAIILAVLTFYLRLVYSYRQNMRRWESGAGREKSAGGRVKGSRKHAQNMPKPSFGQYSHRKRDWLVGAIGMVFMLLGGLLYAGILKSANQEFLWWVLVSIGIVAFSWFFG